MVTRVSSLSLIYCVGHNEELWVHKWEIAGKNLLKSAYLILISHSFNEVVQLEEKVFRLLVKCLPPSKSIALSCQTLLNVFTNRVNLFPRKVLTNVNMAGCVGSRRNLTYIYFVIIPYCHFWNMICCF